MCVVHVKYCNHLLAVDMAGVACRGLCGVRVVRKKDIGMGVRKGCVVLFVCTFLVAFWGFHPYKCLFIFFFMFFFDLFLAL